MPLILLAIASVVIGYLMIQPMLYGGFFKDSIVVLPDHPAMEEMAREFHGAWAMALHSVSTLPFWLMVAGVVTAWALYLKWSRPFRVPCVERFAFVYRLLDNKYYFDWFNENVLAAAARGMGQRAVEGRRRGRDRRRRSTARRGPSAAWPRSLRRLQTRLPVLVCAGHGAGRFRADELAPVALPVGPAGR